MLQSFIFTRNIWSYNTLLYFVLRFFFLGQMLHLLFSWPVVRDYLYSIHLHKQMSWLFLWQKLWWSFDSRPSLRGLFYWILGELFQEGSLFFWGFQVECQDHFSIKECKSTPVKFPQYEIWGAHFISSVNCFFCSIINNLKVNKKNSSMMHKHKGNGSALV